MLDIGSHLSFEIWMFLKRKNNIFNFISVHKLIKKMMYYIIF